MSDRREPGSQGAEPLATAKIPTIEEMIEKLKPGMVNPDKYRTDAPQVKSQKSRRQAKAQKKKKKVNSDVDHVLLVSKYPNSCLQCKKKVKVGDKIWWSSKTKKVIHFACFESYIYEK